MMNLTDIIKGPIITEKLDQAREQLEQYSFLVDRRANKTEIRQAVEMCTIYTGILTSTMDTFGSIISNNLNVTIRLLTVITLVLAIPTIVFSFYGMNVDGLPAIESWIAPVCVAGGGCLVAALIFRFSHLLK